MKILLTFSLLTLHFLLAANLAAHESRPVFIQINETAINEFTANWKIPTTIPEFAIPEFEMPDICSPRDEAIMVQYPDAYIGQQHYQCSDSLSGQQLSLSYPVMNPSVSTLFQLELLNGEQHTRILGPDEIDWTVPDRESTWGVAKEYVLLGIKHIFEGIDHLLFIACLVFIARTGRRILITVTGFTVAHSLTLGLSTLRIIELPIPPVEAAIALSIIFLAHEICLDNRQSWTWRYPVTVSCSFGLLHGFGFAAVLRAIGLPQTELPAALLFFNVGVELGQLIFVLALVCLLISIKNLKLDVVTRRLPAQVISVYVIGSVAGFWLVQRVAGFWS